jgi:hypothetical protein
MPKSPYYYRYYNSFIGHMRRYIANGDEIVFNHGPYLVRRRSRTTGSISETLYSAVTGTIIHQLLLFLLPVVTLLVVACIIRK